MGEYFYHTEYREGCYMISSPEGVNSYLIVDDQRALLVDTGYGFGDLRSYIRQLTDLPLFVINTHGHMDHVGGNGQFRDCLIYMNEKDDSIARDAFRAEQRKKDADMAKHFPVYWGAEEYTSKLPEGFSEEQYINQELPFYLNLEEGMRFDLGKNVLEILEVPGHTKGSIALWEENSGDLIVGDAVSKSVLIGMGSADIASYRTSLQKVYDLNPKRIFHGHDGMITMRDVEIYLDLAEHIESCEICSRPSFMEPGKTDYHFIRAGYTMADMQKEGFAMIVADETSFAKINKEYHLPCAV